MPEPLKIEEPVVEFEFIRMPDSTGFGDYTESGQVVRVSFKGRKGRALPEGRRWRRSEREQVTRCGAHEGGM